MINYLKRRFSNDPDLDAIRAQYAGLTAAIEEMESAFSFGGSITWEQLATYKFSTSDCPIGYPTGKHCVSYRLPDQEGKMVFYTVCVAPPGEMGAFGWHWHPKTRETNTQLVGTAKHNGQGQPPFSVTTFGPGARHDYHLPPNGSLITVFEKVLP